jgi:hypothetical protein
MSFYVRQIKEKQMSDSIREKLTREQRALPLLHYIDPGFVHHRRIQTILGPEAMKPIDEKINQIPDIPKWQREVRINHIYTEAMVMFCGHLEIKPLEEILAVQEGHMFSSTEELGPCRYKDENKRAVNEWIPRGKYDKRVEFHYSTKHICSDTMKSDLTSGSVLSIIAELHAVDEDRIVFRPLVMGSPWLYKGSTEPDFDIAWWGLEFFENFIEDFDEFSKVIDYPVPKSPEPMKYVSEKAFKHCIAKILGDVETPDWGGETSDYFTSHLHLRGRRVTAAFLLKGPSRFSPMTLNHLGKRNDQIVRLAREPAQVLIVQHSHDILPPVRDTLRAFAVQPGRNRRYCLIDGRDSLRLLQAYDLYDYAVEYSKN